jgi:hypothetical protein
MPFEGEAGNHELRILGPMMFLCGLQNYSAGFLKDLLFRLMLGWEARY